MSFLNRLHPERAIDNFTRLDGTITFFSFAKAAMKRVDAKKVMDFGAGRGQNFHDAGKPGTSQFRLELMDLRSGGAEVWACDVDPVVAQHPACHHHHQIGADGILPFPDNMFDVIVSDVTFEHVTNPEIVATELLRVVRPGGYICARTPNKYGYPSLAAMLVPNRLHVAALRRIAPSKEARDVFPTVFKMNSVRAIKRLFAGGTVHWYRDSAEPSYYFNNQILYQAFRLFHRLLPNVLATSLCVFIQKDA
jgi:SAM-dependent methyltransferase